MVSKFSGNTHTPPKIYEMSYTMKHILSINRSNGFYPVRSTFSLLIDQVAYTVKHISIIIIVDHGSTTNQVDIACSVGALIVDT